MTKEIKKNIKVIIILVTILLLIFSIVLFSDVLGQWLPFAKTILKFYLIGYPIICICLSLYIMCFFQNFTTWEKFRLVLPFVVCTVNFLLSGEVDCMNIELIRAEYGDSRVVNSGQTDSAHSVEFEARVSHHAPRSLNAEARVVKIIQIFRKSDGVLLSDMRMDEDWFYTTRYRHPSIVSTASIAKKSPSMEFLDSLPK